MATDYWNHNVAHHKQVLRAMPDGCRTALDVGCGDGLLAVKLAARASEVVGIDPSAEMIGQARTRVAAARTGVDFVQDDFLAAVRSTLLEPGTFDFVCSVTAIHHMDFDAALRAMAALVAPGGRLFVVGIAAIRGPADLAFAALQLPVARTVRLAHGGKSAPEGMPVLMPTVNHTEARRAALTVLPDARWRRTLQYRYTIEWSAPPA
jgi:2-polyprenyl-3-methyl-5-hydroxy-6-metoxy-1,4-benzoquinol methylase